MNARTACRDKRTAARGGGSSSSAAHHLGARALSLATPFFSKCFARTLRVFLARPFPLDPEEKRTSDVDGAERSGEDSERHDPRERPNHLASEDEQREGGGQRGGVCQHRARQRLVDRAIE